MNRKARTWIMTTILICFGLLLSSCSSVLVLLPPLTSTPTEYLTFTSLPPTVRIVLPTDTVVPTGTDIPASDTPRPATATVTLIPPTKTSTLAAPTIDPQQPFVIVQVDSSEGSLSDLLAAEVKKAEALGLTPVVYFSAEW